MSELEREDKVCPGCQLPVYAGHTPECPIAREKLKSPEVYNTANQITENTTAGWEGHYNNDQDLYAVGVERTRALRELGQIYGTVAYDIGGIGLEWAIDNTEKKVGTRFDSHGIAGKIDPVVELNQVLSEGIRKDKTLYTMGFERQIEATGAFGAEHPITRGGIILCSEIDKKLSVDGIKYVFLGEEYTRVIDLLRKKYPSMEIVPWHDAPRILTEEYNKTINENLPIPELTEQNRPYYNKGKIYGRGLKQGPTEVPSPPPESGDVGPDDVW